MQRNDGYYWVKVKRDSTWIIVELVTSCTGKQHIWQTGDDVDINEDDLDWNFIEISYPRGI